MDPREQRAREIQDAIGHVLLHDWDPIGIVDEPMAQDEYNSYIGIVYRHLASGASELEIAQLLSRIEEKQMGLGSSPAELRLPIAAKLRALDIRLERQ